MKQSRFTKAQIIGMLKEQATGSPTAEVCRKHGISSATFYKYKARFGGMNVSEAQRLRALEDENSKLKKLLAQAMLDIAIHGVSQRRACEVLAVDWLGVRYRSSRPDDAAERAAMKAVAAERRRFGYQRIHIMLERQGNVMNLKTQRRL